MRAALLGSVLAIVACGGRIARSPDDADAAADAAVASATSCLDPAFGRAGRSEVTFFVDEGLIDDPLVRGLVLTKNGSLVVAYDAPTKANPLIHHEIVARFHPNGTLDTSFGGKGYLQIGADQTFPYGLVLQADEKVIVYGNAQFGSQYELFISRIGADGRLDPTYGNAGSGSAQLAYDDSLDEADDAALVTAQGEEQLAFSGRSGFSTLVGQLSGAGVTSSAFADAKPLRQPTGTATTPHTGISSVVRVDGRRVVLDYEESAGPNPNLRLFAYDAAGASDVAFHGAAPLDLAFVDRRLGKIAALPDGSILAATITGSEAAPTLFSARIAANGVRVPSSSNAAVGLRGSHLSALLPLADGRALLVANRGDLGEAVVVRLTASGGLDASYGTAGSSVIPLYAHATPPKDNAQMAFALQTDGRLVGAAGRFLVRACN